MWCINFASPKNPTRLRMYHSHSYQDEAFDFFVSFLKNTIEGEREYEVLVKPVINDAHLLAKGERDYFSISRNNYSIITYLVEVDSTYFKQLDPEHLTTDDYNRILKLANTQREAFLS